MNLDDFLLLGVGLFLGHIVTKVTYDSVTEYSQLNKEYRESAVRARNERRDKLKQGYLFNRLFEIPKPKYRDVIKRVLKKNFQSENYVVDFKEVEEKTLSNLSRKYLRRNVRKNKYGRKRRGKL